VRYLFIEFIKLIIIIFVNLFVPLLSIYDQCKYQGSYEVRRCAHGDQSCTSALTLHLVFVLCVGPADTHRMYCSLPRLLVLIPL
jgi:hypothetical protein